MKKHFVIFLTAIALALAPAAFTPETATPPAQAGYGYWSEGTCQPRPPMSVQWLGTANGAWYDVQFYGIHLVERTFYQRFAERNWECGTTLGPPIGGRHDLHNISPLYYPGEWVFQDFLYARLMKRFDGVHYICPHNGSGCYQII